MNPNTWFDSEETPRHHKKPINTYVFCKKNKLGGGRYGSHKYVNGRCELCNKIDPAVKKSPAFPEM